MYADVIGRFKIVFLEKPIIMERMKKILGISAYFHDSAAALILDGQVFAAAQEERFTRKKHTAEFPHQAIQFCLQSAGLELNDLDAIVFYEKPFLKFERLLSTYYAFAPRGLWSFVKAMPIWLKEKLFLKRNLRIALSAIGPFDPRKVPLLFSEHHLSHAASSFFTAPFSEAVILSIDGVGEWSTATISKGKGSDIQSLKKLDFPHSLGLLYSAFTYFLGFRVNSGEYKLMGLAPYGNPEEKDTQKFLALIREHLVKIYPDGSIWLNQNYFSYATSLRMVPDRKWEALFGFPRRLPETPIQAQHENLAWAIQHITEEVILKMAANAQAISGAENLCLAGGVALNCVAIGKLEQAGIFKKIYVPPAAGDAGGAIGAALAIQHGFFKEPRVIGKTCSPYLGPVFTNQEIQNLNRNWGAAAEHFEDRTLLNDRVAELLADGQIIGWFQGAMEFGARALGNRSIIADPRDPGMQKRLNLAIKKRESFRPFAPTILEAELEKHFPNTSPSPYMTKVAYYTKESKQSAYPAVIHQDGSARIQTLNAEQNPNFHALLKAFYLRTACPMLINTSFNVRGEPIVCTPEDAYRCFRATDMDYLVMGDFLYAKTAQNTHQDASEWEQAFLPD